MKVYRHYQGRSGRAVLIIFGILAVGALAGLLWSASQPSPPAPPFPVFLLVFAVAAFNFWMVGGIVREVRLEEDGSVELVAPLRTIRLFVPDLVSIAPSEATQGKLYVLKHRDGSIRFDPKLDGMHELIGELKRQNPNLELRGI